MSILSLDIGGTQLRAALFDTNGRLLAQKRYPTEARQGRVTERLIALIEALWETAEPVQVIAAAVPGPVSPDGVILSAPNIPEWENYPLQSRLEEHFGTPVLLANDANMAALGEWAYGAGRGSQDMLYLTISTGIGGGAICQGRLLTGHQGLGAEFGHVPVSDEGPICSCGQPGHLEAYASGTAIAAWVQSRLQAGAASSLPADRPISGREIALAAQNGDALAQEAFQRAGHFLAVGVSGFLHIFNPSMLVLGGGVVQSGELLLAPFRKTLRQRIFRPEYLDKLKIEIARLGDDAGLRGTLAFALQHIGEKTNSKE